MFPFAPSSIAAEIGWSNRDEDEKEEKENTGDDLDKDGSSSMKSYSSSDNNDDDDDDNLDNSDNSDNSGNFDNTNSHKKDSFNSELSVTKRGRKSTSPKKNKKHKSGNNPNNNNAQGKSPSIKDKSKDVVSVNRTVVLEKEGSEIAVQGRARVSVLTGQISILGYTLEKTKECTRSGVTMSSPSWSSAITIRNTWTGATTIKIESLVNEESRKAPSSPSPTFTICAKEEKRPVIHIPDSWRRAVDSTLTGDIISNPPRILICGAKNVGKSTFLRYLTNRILSVSLQEEDCEADLTQAALPGKVTILDCDCGQPELSPPSMMTLSNVYRPILSLPHSHMIGCCQLTNDHFTVGNHDAFHHLDAAFFGHLSSKEDPVRYTQAVKQLLNSYNTQPFNQHDNSSDQPNLNPLLINTDGWVKGMGQEILESLVDILRPTHIIQILGSTSQKSFSLSPHVMHNYNVYVVDSFGFGSGMMQRQHQATGEGDDAGYYGPSTANLLPEQGQDFTSNAAVIHEGNYSDATNILIASSDLRALSLCSYFMGGSSSFDSLAHVAFKQGGIHDINGFIGRSLQAQTPYVIHLDDIRIISCCEDDNQADEEYILNSLQGTLCGLCTSSSHHTDNMSTCQGLGFVRSIDPKLRLLFLLTPIPFTLLKTVNTIVRGNLSLPLEFMYRGAMTGSCGPYHSYDNMSGGTIGEKAFNSQLNIKANKNNSNSNK